MSTRSRKSKDKPTATGPDISKLSAKEKQDLLARLAADTKKDKATTKQKKRDSVQAAETAAEHAYQAEKGTARSTAASTSQSKNAPTASQSRSASAGSRGAAQSSKRMAEAGKRTTSRTSKDDDAGSVNFGGESDDEDVVEPARNREHESSLPPSTPVAKAKKRSLPESDNEEQPSSPSGTDTPIAKKARGIAPVQLSVNAPRALKPAARRGARRGHVKTAPGTAAQPVEISSDVEDALIQDIVAEYTPYKQVINPADKNKPRLEDFSPTTKKLGKKLRALFALYLALEDMFPEDEAANAKVDKLWAQMTSKAAAGSKIARRGTRYDMEEDYQDDIRNAGHNVDAGWRGRVGDTAQLLVDREHKFDELQNNELRKDMASDLTKNGALAYRDWKTRTGYLKNPLIPALLWKHFLIKQPKQRSHALSVGEIIVAFKDMPNHLIAFLLTALQRAVDGWKTGTFLKVEFSQANYDDIYENHLVTMEEVERLRPGRMDALRKWIWETACASAGISPSITVVDSGNSGFMSQADMDRILEDD